MKRTAADFTNSHCIAHYVVSDTALLHFAWYFMISLLEVEYIWNKISLNYFTLNLFCEMITYDFFYTSVDFCLSMFGNRIDNRCLHSPMTISDDWGKRHAESTGSAFVELIYRLAKLSLYIYMYTIIYTYNYIIWSWSVFDQTVEDKSSTIPMVPAHLSVPSNSGRELGIKTCEVGGVLLPDDR